MVCSNAVLRYIPPGTMIMIYESMLKLDLIFSKNIKFKTIKIRRTLKHMKAITF